MGDMAEAEVTETPRPDDSNPNSGSWIELGTAFLAIVGLLTIVIGGSLVIRNGLTEDEPRDRTIRIVEHEEPEQRCYEEVVSGGGGLFGDLDDHDDGDFDAEARFADDRERRVVIICEDW